MARPVETVVRYPTSLGRYPLIVFGHGFASTPGSYSSLLRAWASAGYVVAAPVFPLGNAHAPGGPSEADLVNQPRDMSFFISRLLRLDTRPGPLPGTIDDARSHSAVHPGAVYLHQGEQFEVRVLDLEANVAIVTRSDPDYYTQSRDTTDIEVVIEQERRPLSAGTEKCYGTVRVTNQVVAFARKQLATGEVLGILPLDLLGQRVYGSVAALSFLTGLILLALMIVVLVGSLIFMRRQAERSAQLK